MITTYNQAKRLKELGIPYGAIQYYNTGTGELDEDVVFYPHKAISAISVPDALQWIREKYKIVCGIGVIACCKYPYYGAYIDSNNQEITLEPKEKHPLAESALLEELLIFLETKVE